MKTKSVYSKKIAEISAYYLQLLAELKLSDRLNTEEKKGQVAFLVREWERELGFFSSIQIGAFVGCFNFLFKFT